jgi:hypothetical protein
MAALFSFLILGSKQINLSKQCHPHPQHNSYLEPENFKQFTIEHGNVVWGKNWDMIFSIDDLYNFPL